MATEEEKKFDTISPSPQHSISAGTVEPTKVPSDDDFEVFKQTIDGVQFRLVGWIKASVIFLKSKLVIAFILSILHPASCFSASFSYRPATPSSPFPSVYTI
jgi:hypothetical protein